MESIQGMTKAEMATMGLKQSTEKSTGKIVEENPISFFQSFAMIIAARFVKDPLQTMLPMFLFFMLPILFFSIIR